LPARQCRDGLLARGLDGQDVHAVHRLALDAVGRAAFPEIGGLRRALHGGAHGVLVVLDHEDDRQVPELGHVVGLGHLALVRGAVAEIGEGHAVVAEILVGEGEARADRHLRADDAVAAVEMLLLGEHVHGAALALGVAPLAARQLGHHAPGVHAAGQHVPVVAVGGDALVALARGGLQSHDDGLLPDIEVTEAADQAHAVKLAGLFLETPDQQHVAVIGLQLISRDIRFRTCSGSGFPGRHLGQVLPVPLVDAKIV
jgi:hypothetical protein